MRRRATPTRARSYRPSSDPRPGRRCVTRRPRSRRPFPTPRRRLRCEARRRAWSRAWLLDEALLLQPRGRDVLAVLLIDGDLLVHIVQLRLGQLRADRVQEPLDRAVVLLQQSVAGDRRDVVSELQVLVVVEKDEVLRHDARVAREEKSDVDLLAFERGHGERAASIERFEVLKGQPVNVLEPGEAKGPLRAGALRRAAENHVLRERREVADLLEVLGGRRVLRYDEPVLVGGRRVIQHGEALRLERLLEAGLSFFRIGGWLGDLAVLVDEGEKGRQILGVDVDLARFDRRLDDLATSEVELPRDLVSVRLEDLAVELAQRDLLVEVGGS